MTLIYGIFLNACSIEQWSFGTNDWAHLFFSFCELIKFFCLIPCLFYSNTLPPSLVTVIKYFANVFCLLSGCFIFIFSDLTMTARFS